MRILQIVKTNRGATWAFNQAKWLSEKGIEIITVLPNDTEGFAKKYKENGMYVLEGDWSLPISRPWKFFLRTKEIRKVVADLKPDMIHMHFVTNVIMLRLSLRKSNIPRLFQVLGPLHLESKMFGFLEIHTATKADYWAGACNKTCSIYKKNGIDENRIFLAYYGSPINKSNICRGSDTILRNQYGIKDDEILVAMVSYFYKPKKYLGQKRGLKGHEDFIDALQIAMKINSKIRPIIIGNAWDGSESYEMEVHKYAEKKLGKSVIFTGYRNDIPLIYPEIDIAVHPSHSENLGGAAESLALAVPTIATNIGGFPDIVLNNDTGLLVPPEDPNELALAILQMAQDLDKARSMAKAGRNLVNSKLSIDVTSSHIKDIYEIITSKMIKGNVK